MNKMLILVILSIVLSSCGLSMGEMQESFSQTITALPPVIHTVVHTVETTKEVERVVTKIVVHTMIVTATYAGPTLTPTATHTPEPTNTPKPTVDDTRADKKPGTYLIGSQIAPGNWRSLGTGEGCYWEIRDHNGEIVANDFGQAGGVMHVPASGYVVELDPDCGSWNYLE